MTTLEQVKLALGISEDDMDAEIDRLMTASLMDMGIAGVNGENAVITNPLVLQAVITYCYMHTVGKDRYSELKRSYDEYKAQMGMASGWTVWSVSENG